MRQRNPYVNGHVISVSISGPNPVAKFFGLKKTPQVSCGVSVCHKDMLRSGGVTRCKLAVPNGEIEISIEDWIEYDTYACTFNFVIDAKDWQTEESLAVVNGLVQRLSDYLVERNANRFQLEWIDMSERESEKQRECSH